MSYQVTYEMWFDEGTGTQGPYEITGLDYAMCKRIMESKYRGTSKNSRSSVPFRTWGDQIHSWNTSTDSSSNSNSSYSSSSSSAGVEVAGAVAGAVIGGTFGLIGSGLGWIGNGIKEGMDEAEIEEQEAKAEGGERLAKWEKDQANTEKWVGRFGRYGGSYIGICVLGAIGAEIVAGPLAVGWFGYVTYKVVSKTGQKLFGGKKVQTNNPPKVQDQYRKESIK